MNHPVNNFRIGTLAGKGKLTPEYIKAILPHGFESFPINFWKNLGEVDLTDLAPWGEVLAGSWAVVSSLRIFGNRLETTEIAQLTLEGWRQCIRHAHLFGCGLVCGFTGRLRGQPIPASLPRFREIFGELSRLSADHGVQIAFENCPMGGDCQKGNYNFAHNPAA